MMTKISLINDPRNAYGKLYSVDYLNNMVGGEFARPLHVFSDQFPPSPLLRGALLIDSPPPLPAPSGANEKSFPRGAPMQHLSPRQNPESVEMAISTL